MPTLDRSRAPCQSKANLQIACLHACTCSAGKLLALVRTFLIICEAHPDTLALVQVAVKPYMIYSNAYEYVSPDFDKAPTAAQVPTVFRGAVDLTLFSAGTTPIKVWPHLQAGMHALSATRLHARISWQQRACTCCPCDCMLGHAAAPAKMGLITSICRAAGQIVLQEQSSAHVHDHAWFLPMAMLICHIKSIERPGYLPTQGSLLQHSG